MYLKLENWLLKKLRNKQQLMLQQQKQLQPKLALKEQLRVKHRPKVKHLVPGRIPPEKNLWITYYTQEFVPYA